MDEIENSEKSKTWEEEIYWNHFHSVHFSRTLPTTFHHHLTLPSKFIANEITKLPENAILKGPNGMIWHVKLLNDESNHVMLTGDGWKEFVKAYNLLKSDLLIFKYDRINKSFEALFFDHTSSCEREDSYFVKKCEQSESNNGAIDGQVKSTRYENAVCSSDSTTYADDDECRESNKVTLKANGSTARKEVPSNQLKRRKSSIDNFDVDGRDKRRTSIKDKFASEQHNSPKRTGNTTWRKARRQSMANDEDEEVLCKEQSKKRKSSSGISVACYKSNRRPITEAERNQAYAKACRSATDDSFILIMRPSHVYKRFSLIIPRQWKPTSFSRSINQEVILRVKDRTWVTSYCSSNNHGYGGLEGGWKKFALENNLEEFDVCLFLPGGLDNMQRFVLDVLIFRVVPEITPVSPL